MDRRWTNEYLQPRVFLDQLHLGTLELLLLKYNFAPC
jgi:hypothetical protein